MIYYLLDASALVLRYDSHSTLRATIDALYIQKQAGKAFFYVPNVCVVEVFNTFARMHYRSPKIDQPLYKSYCKNFSEHIRNRKLLYCYNLNRYHNFNADEIYEVEHKMPPVGGKGWLSSSDIIIVAMGMELKKIHPNDDVYIVTNDERLSKVSDPSKNPNFAKSIYLQNTAPSQIPS